MVTRIIDLNATSLQSMTVPSPVNLATGELADLKSAKTGLCRRVLAVSEGIHNGIEFTTAEIQGMVTDTEERKQADNGEYYQVPIILDHSNKFLDKIGGTLAVQFSTDAKAAISDIRFWENTDMEKEVCAKIREDPTNVFFSVRVRGELVEPSMAAMKLGAWAKIVNMRWMHLALVNEPADENARILEELASTVGKLDLGETTMPTENLGTVTAPIPAVASALNLTSATVTDVTTGTATTNTVTNFGITDNSGYAPPATYEPVIITVPGTGTDKTFDYRLVPVTPESDIHLNKDIANETRMASDESSKQIADLTADLKKEKDANVVLQTELAAAKALAADLTVKLEKSNKDLAELDAKIPLVTEILAINGAVKKEFLYSLTKEQLVEFKGVVAPAVPDVPVSSQKSVDQSAPATPVVTEKSALQLSREAFGKIE